MIRRLNLGFFMSAIVLSIICGYSLFKIIKARDALLDLENNVLNYIVSINEIERELFEIAYITTEHIQDPNKDNKTRIYASINKIQQYWGQHVKYCKYIVDEKTSSKILLSYLDNLKSSVENIFSLKKKNINTKDLLITKKKSFDPIFSSLLEFTTRHKAAHFDQLGKTIKEALNRQNIVITYLALHLVSGIILILIIGIWVNKIFVKHVTELNDKTNALAESETKFRKIMEASLVGIYVIQDLQFKYVNPTMVHYFGYKPEEMVSQLNPIELVLPEYRETLQNSLSKMVLGEPGNPHEVECVRKDGSTFYAMVWIAGILYGGRPASVGTLIDISEEKQARQEIKKRTLLYQTLFEQSPCAVMLINPETGRVVEFNNRAASQLGYTREEFAKTSIYHWEAKESTSQIKEHIKQIMEEGKDQFETKHRKKNGDIIHVVVNVRVVTISGKKLFHIIVQDVTKQKLAEQELKKYREHLEDLVEERTKELKEAEKATSNLLERLRLAKEDAERKALELESFAFSVSHDLKVPLRSIYEYSQLLREEHDEYLNEDGKRALNAICRSAMDMRKLIDDLLEYSRIENRSIIFREIDLEGLIEDILNTRQDEIDKRNIIIDRDIEVKEIIAEPEGMYQALSNLIDNAIKFSREQDQPQVAIRSREEKENWLVQISDNGLGFDMKYRDKIFEIFHRIDKKGDYPGTGIGLAIVKKVVERMGGKVWAEAKEGEGATFFLSIPKRKVFP